MRNLFQALDKIRLESLTDKSKLDAQPELFIHIIPDKANGTLSIIDSGIGMTKAGELLHCIYLSICFIFIWRNSLGETVYCIRFGEQSWYHCKIWDQGVHGSSCSWC